MDSKRERVHIVYEENMGRGRAVIGLFRDDQQAYLYVENYIRRIKIEKTPWEKLPRGGSYVWMNGAHALSVEEHELFDRWEQHPDFANEKDA